MSKDKAMEKEKILQVMEKYRDYFNEWDADVAFGVNGKNIFYVLASRESLKPSCFSGRRISWRRLYWGRLRRTLT